MQKLKSILFIIGLMLALLSGTTIYVAIQSMSSLTPADSYEDNGVYTFVPYQVLPIQVKNTGATGRYRRMNPTRTVYMVYYQDTAGRGYRWQEEAGSWALGQDTVDAGVGVQRRVLTISDRGSYITVEPEETARSYTAGLRQRYVRVLIVSALYLVIYLIIYGVIYIRRGL